MTMHVTRTWIEDGKLITETIPEEVVYKREWVGLTDEDVGRCFEVADGTIGSLIRAIEAKLKERNA